MYPDLQIGVTSTLKVANYPGEAGNYVPFLYQAVLTAKSSVLSIYCSFLCFELLVIWLDEFDGSILVLTF